MSPKCKHCGAPVTLVPDGDRRYELPSYPDKYFLKKEGFQAGLKRGAEIAAAEEELPGAMPDELQYMPSEDIARLAVRITKRNIEQAILKEAQSSE